MNKILQIFLIALLCCSILSCENDSDGRIVVTSGPISEEIQVGHLNSYTIIGASGSVQQIGNLPEGYEIESAGIVYGTDSSELKINSLERFEAGDYDEYYGCFRYVRYGGLGRSVVTNVQIQDTIYTENGAISQFGYCQIFGSENSFVCPLINLQRGTKYYLRAFAHISDGKSYNKYVYGQIKGFVTGGIHEDPTVYVELYGLGIGISKMDIELRYGVDADRACYYFNSSGELGGYKDWRVPTLEELEEIYKLRNSIGGFYSAKYFSNKTVAGSDHLYWYWDFETNQAGHEGSEGFGGRLRLVRNI